MAKIAVFVPRQYMLEQVISAAAKENMELMTAKVIDNSEAVGQARQLIDQGAQIIVARGLHALMIKKYTRIPVVEIALTGQNMGILIKQAKSMTDNPHPNIALIGYRNLFGDLSLINEIFDINLMVWNVDEPEQVEGYVTEAMEKRPDVVIGGDLVGMAMEKYDIPYMFFHSTEDSIRNALQIAGKMSYTADVEKISNAQLVTVTDTMLQGVIRIDSDRRVTTVNRTAEQYLKRGASELVGRYIEDEIGSIDINGLNAVLSGQRDIFSTTVRIHGQALRYIIAPVQYDGRIDGVILSFSKLTAPKSQSTQRDTQARKSYLQGYVATTEFSDIKTNDRRMRMALELAKQYAGSKMPVLISDEMGYNKERIAHAIHNNSARQSMPFVSINPSGLDDREQMNILFGGFLDNPNQGLVEQANLGTIFINEIENLSLFCQYQIYRLVRRRPVICGDELRTRILDVRLIAGARRDLRELVEEGKFRSDLYYAIAGLSLELVPLRERRRDILQFVDEYLDDFCAKNACLITITDAAKYAIANYSWEGNEIQLENFCERLFITTTRKVIDDIQVRALLTNLYPDTGNRDKNGQSAEKPLTEAQRLAAILAECDGNRMKAAKKLGISTTTLWRRMKRYGLQ